MVERQTDAYLLLEKHNIQSKIIEQFEQWYADQIGQQILSPDWGEPERAPH